jgi:Ca-activated chloride channel homolog
VSEQQFTEQERLHQLLCAYVLNEASAEERAEVERALEGSPELREERARLEATIGMVRTTLTSGDTLSLDATSKLIAAAQRKQRPRYVTSSALKIAAGFLVLVGGATAYRAWTRMNARSEEKIAFGYNLDGASGTTVASADKREGGTYRGPGDSKAAPAPAPEAEAPMRVLGYGGGESVAGSNLSMSPPSEAKPVGQIEAKNFNQPTIFELHDAAAKAQDSSDVNLVEDWGQPGAKPAPAPEIVDRSLDSVDTGSGGTAIGSGVGAIRYSRKAAPGQAKAEKAKLPAAPASGGGGGPATLGPTTPEAVTPGLARAAGGAAAPRPLPETQLRARELNSVPADGKEASVDELLGLQDADERRVALGEELKRFDEASDKKDGADDFYLGRAQLERQRFTPEEVDRRCDLFLGHCRRRPNERPRDMFFRFWGDNPFEVTQFDQLSTFSVDVDTASYTLARNYLAKNYLPQKEQVRTEEFLNYFKPDLAPPKEGTFAIHTELAPSLFSTQPNTWMLRVGIRGKEVSRSERQPLALTFVIDVSGSMKEGDRLGLVKHALRLLLSELDARDAVSIVAFSSEARLILPMTAAASRGLIESALDPLQPDGGTNTEAGLRMGYEQAVAALTKFSHNRVVLLTDGVANIGITDPNVLTASVERQRKAGIYLNTIGVGMNNHNDALLEQLADKGDGVCNYVDDAKEARRALVENFTGAFEPIARDVKVQVEFDPAQVERYRLLGYENRAIADADFRNEKVDAGEVNAGHQVVALYEIVRTGGGDGPLAKVNLRWKQPHVNGVALAGNEEATEISAPVLAGRAAASYAATSAGYRRSVLVAQFAEFLRRSYHARGDSLDALIAEAAKLDAELRDPEFSEFVQMVVRSKTLVLDEQSRFTELERHTERYRYNCYLRAQLEDLRRDSDRGLVAQLEAENLQLEAQIRELLHQRLEQRVK